MRVLVVNAEHETTALVHATLDELGWHVVEAVDGPGAIVALEMSPMDLVVVDLGLPSGNPLTLVTMLREGRPNLSILVLSSGPSTKQGVAAMLAGADDFLVKPFSAPEMMARLGAAARRRVTGARTRSRLQEVITGVTTDVTDAIIITTPDQRILSFNPAAEELYGFAAEEVLYHPAGEVLRWVGTEEDLAVGRERFAEHGSWHGVGEQYHRDGSVIRVRSSTQVLRDDEGNVIGVIAINRPFEPPAGGVEHHAFELVESEIAAGLLADEFEVHYQPIFRISDRSIVGVEALVRWRHDDALRMPEDFIDIAEHSDLILEIGRVVFSKASHQLREWNCAGHDLHLALNVATRQLLNGTLVEDLASVLESTGIIAKQLTLEVTETALIEDITQASRVLMRVADLGVGISIDDFGTGWASLTYLRQLPVTNLKIDGSFVAGLGENERDTAICRSVLALGSELGLSVIAEGIETETQLEVLRLLGCRFGQGFLVATAQPPSTFHF